MKGANKLGAGKWEGAKGQGSNTDAHAMRKPRWSLQPQAQREEPLHWDGRHHQRGKKKQSRNRHVSLVHHHARSSAARCKPQHDASSIGLSPRRKIPQTVTMDCLEIKMQAFAQLVARELHLWRRERAHSTSPRSHGCMARVSAARTFACANHATPDCW